MKHSWEILLICLIQFLQGHSSKTFHYKSYDSIATELETLAEDFSEYLDVFTTQERYGLPSPGNCGTDSANHAIPCKQHVAVVTKKSTLLKDPERPEVFFSGCLHGNERIGSTTLIESISLFLHAAACVDGKQTDACLIEEPYLSWLSFMVTSRVIVFMPMTNSLGYYQNKREENQIDPNRDFPYDQTSNNCMKTIAARSVNEVWREHIFQLALTFHGGMTAIAYEWGAPNHPGPHKDVSPDDVAQVKISSALSSYSGHFSGQKAYPHGRLNDLVYPVHGGMEDWGYGASWDSSSTCNPSTFGGYPRSKTNYGDATLRAFNILIETSDSKQPSQNKLGTDEELFFANGAGNGHIPRNIRLVLMITDIVQPHLPWKAAPGLQNDAWSFAPDNNLYYEGQVEKQYNSQQLKIVAFEWGVWGAVTVDETKLYLGPWQTDCEADDTLVSGECLAQSSLASLACQTSGDGKWKHPTSQETSTFSCELDWSAMLDGDYFVVAQAKVDQDWKTQPSTHYPNLPPQSHVVNARTNEGWNKQSNGHKVAGHMYWYSFPIKISLQTTEIQSETPTAHPSMQPSESSATPSPTVTQTERMGAFLTPKITAMPTEQPTLSSFISETAYPIARPISTSNSTLGTNKNETKTPNFNIDDFSDHQDHKSNSFPSEIFYWATAFSFSGVILIIGLLLIRRFHKRQRVSMQTPYVGVDLSQHSEVNADNLELQSAVPGENDHADSIPARTANVSLV